MKCSCEMTVDFASQKDAEAAVVSLKQEEEFKKRSESKVNVRGSSVHVSVVADDVVALRATMNSYLRALQAMSAVDEE